MNPLSGILGREPLGNPLHMILGDMAQIERVRALLGDTCSPGAIESSLAALVEREDAPSPIPAAVSSGFHARRPAAYQFD